MLKTRNIAKLLFDSRKSKERTFHKINKGSYFKDKMTRKLDKSLYKEKYLTNKFQKKLHKSGITIG